jgi:hypothetical protein
MAASLNGLDSIRRSFRISPFDYLSQRLGFSCHYHDTPQWENVTHEGRRMARGTIRGEPSAFEGGSLSDAGVTG